MRSAVGNSLLLYVSVTIVIVVMLVFSGIMAYTKAYSVKNRIIEIIEKNGTYQDSYAEINSDLANVGYKITNVDYCNSDKIIKKVSITGQLEPRKGDTPGVIRWDGDDKFKNDYNFCVYRVYLPNGSYYYKIVTFVQFDFPVIGDLLIIPVYGETKILGKKYNYE